MYIDRNFQTKKQLKDAIASGAKVRIWQPDPFGGNESQNGRVWLEGPHYPQPHKWYASGVVKDGWLVEVK